MRMWRIAWRNLWRNRRRTGIVLSAMVISTAALILTYALLLGLAARVVASLTELGVGEAQVHAPGYLGEPSIHRVLSNPDAVLAAARARGIRAAPRGLSVALLSSGPRSAGAQVWGVVPEAEREAGELPRHLLGGAYLSGGRARGEVVLGRKLAKALGVEPGAKVFAVAEGADGSIGTEAFVVRGILSSASDAIDRTGAFVARPDFDALFSAEGKVHEISLSSLGRMPIDEVARAVRPAAGADEVKTWRALFPGVGQFHDLWDVVLAIIAGMFFLAAGLGVLNASLMATYERVPELGLAKALGASPAQLVVEVGAEGVLLALVSTVLGGGLGVSLGLLAERYGLDISSVTGPLSFASVTMEPLWRAKVTFVGLWQPLLLMWVVSFAGTLYPVSRAVRLDPIVAMNRT